MENNPLLGFIPGYKSTEANVTHQETNMLPPEGLVPPPMKNEVPCTLHILIVNPPDDDKLVDLGSLYGDEDMGNLTHVPKLWAHTRSIGEDSKVADKYKVLEERLRIVEGFNIFKVLDF